MKKLLTILAISTISIVPSVTLVSCFNETTPKYLTFNESDPIGSINKAITNRSLKLSAGDFGFKDDDEASTYEETTDGMSSIINEISNSFTKIEDILKANKWLNNESLSKIEIKSPSVIPGEDISVHITEIKTLETKADVENKNTFVDFEVQEGYSFNWLKETKDKNFFLNGKTNDFTNVNKKDSFKIQSYLISSFNNDKLDTKEGQIIRESAAKEIYSSLISQSISTIKNKSQSGWKKINRLNSSTVVFDNGKSQEMKSFTKGNVSSIADFLFTTARYDNVNFVDMMRSLVTALDSKEAKDNGVIIKTNLFEFNPVATEADELYKFKVVKE